MGGSSALCGALGEAGASAGREAFGGGENAAGGAPGGLGGEASSGGAPSPAGGASAGSPSSEGGTESTMGGADSGGDSALGGGASVSGGMNGNGGVSANGGAAEGGNDVGGSGATGGTASAGGSNGAGGDVGSGGGVAGGGGANGGSSGAASGGASSEVAGGSGCQKSPEICDGVDNDCNSQIDDNACPAKCTGFVAAGRSFMACATATTEVEAAAMCATHGMRLAWLDSADKVSGVLTSLQAVNHRSSTPVFDEVYFGATDAEQEGHWHWILGADFWLGNGSGSPVNGAFSNWASNRPNNYPKTPGENCAVSVVDFPSDGNPGQWNDVTCTQPHAALCEVP